MIQNQVIPYIVLRSGDNAHSYDNGYNDRRRIVFYWALDISCPPPAALYPLYPPPTSQLFIHAQDSHGNGEGHYREDSANALKSGAPYTPYNLVLLLVFSLRQAIPLRRPALLLSHTLLFSNRASLCGKFFYSLLEILDNQWLRHDEVNTRRHVFCYIVR